MCLTLEMAGQVHSFHDTDKLLHATTHCPLASSSLMSVSLFVIPQGSTKAAQGCHLSLM